MNQPVVSVIVTTYNRVGYLSETLNSILTQSFQNFELIVVDNMSEDGTEAYVLDIQDDRVSYFKNPNHGVVAINRNFGIKRAKGRLVAFCDDDDLWKPEKLEEQVKLMDENPNVALCYTNAESFCEQRVIKPLMVPRTILKSYLLALLQGNYIPNSSVLLKIEVFHKLGLLTTDDCLREDYHMWLRVAKYYELKGIHKPLLRYRVHINNTAGNRALETLRAIRTLKSVLPLIEVPLYIVLPNIGIQYLKYFFYWVSRK